MVTPTRTRESLFFSLPPYFSLSLLLSVLSLFHFVFKPSPYVAIVDTKKTTCRVDALCIF